MAIFISQARPEDNFPLWAARKKVFPWTVHPDARKGSRVVFYVGRPMSAFVAEGIVVDGKLLDGARYGWPGKKMARVRIERVARHPLEMKYARKRFTGWRWLLSPIPSEDVPPRYERRLRSLLFGPGGRFAADADAQLAEEIAATEGEERLRLVRHRKREAWKRDEKIQTVLREKGRLVCEVPRCRFDFDKRYGEIGRGYAQVHHRKPLSDATRPRQTLLKDLAIVCANCHAMIHRGGKCRDMRSLIRPSR